MQAILYDLIANIDPIDQLERRHQKETLEWIQSGTKLFRLEKPATPPKHLVSYFLLLDTENQTVLLVDHKKAQLWLPPGGHVEPGEHPKDAVKRELFEELGLQADFLSQSPLFLTVTETVGKTVGHTDVSLWYLLKGSSEAPINYDQQEFNKIHWFHFNDIPYENTDPHMKRFIQKLLNSQVISHESRVS